MQVIIPNAYQAASVKALDAERATLLRICKPTREWQQSYENAFFEKRRDHLDRKIRIRNPLLTRGKRKSFFSGRETSTRRQKSSKHRAQERKYWQQYHLYRMSHQHRRYRTQNPQTLRIAATLAMKAALFTLIPITLLKGETYKNKLARTQNPKNYRFIKFAEIR